MVRVMDITPKNIAPPTAMGWTHVWAEGEQLPMDDDTAAALAMLGLIEYSPDDGPNARVYRCCEGVSLAKVKSMLK